jgi:hypothetical protein
MKRFVVVAVAALAIPFGTPLIFAADSEAPKKPSALLDIDPTGKPKHGGPARMTIWWEGGQWHVHTHGSKKTLYQFNGTIRVQGGSVDKLKPESDNEARGKLRDLDLLNGTKTIIHVALQTQSAGDGFSFTLTDDAKELIFNIQVNRQSDPSKIVIGRHAQSPPTSPFMLPAFPNKKAE